MIPYFTAITWHVGPIPIQVWGLFVALGILLGLQVSRWYACRIGLRKEVVDDTAVWIVAGALLGARLWHVLLYEPAFYWQNPIEILQIWHGGMSVMGGFLIAFAVGIWRLRKGGYSVGEYANALVFGLPFGLMIGRIGCFLIHDHPGIACPGCALAVFYPDGVARLDHGLLLSLNGALMSLLFLWLVRRERAPWFFVAVFGLWYGVMRFALDFLRVGDTRWWGLTSTQYACLTLVGFSVLWFLRERARMIQSHSPKS